MIVSHCFAADYDISELKKDIISKDILRQIKQQMPDTKTSDIEINFENFEQLVAKKRDFDAFRIDYNKPQSFLGALLLDFEFYYKNSNQRIKKERLYVQNKVYATAYKLNKKINRHGIIKDSDIESARIVLTSKANHYILDKKYIIGKQSRSTLYSGTILNNRHIESVPDIKKGERVAIRIKNKQFEVDSHAEALESGHVGEKIRIKLSLSKKIIVAKIVDGDTISDETQKIVVLAN